MIKTPMDEALHIIETMLRRRLKAQNKTMDESWIKTKALEIYDEAEQNGEFIQTLEDAEPQ